MDNRAIGVFDSGLGGLTAVKEFRSIMPHETIVYFGDTGRVPYGSRSKEILNQYAAQDFRFLMSKQVKMIVAACGTVSSVAGDLGASLPLPFMGVVEPTAFAAAKATHNKKIGVIGTTATIRSGSYRRALQKIDPEIAVFEQDCPLFVPLVENGFIEENDEVTRLVAERYLPAIRDAGVDTLILGCTHYPIIRRIIQNVMGGGVTLIDSGRETALACSAFLQEKQLLCDSNNAGESTFFVSDRVENFARIGGIFLGEDVTGNVRQIDIYSY